MKERALALGGLLQAAALVHRLAHVGSADGAALAASLDSVFRIDAVDAAAVFGGVAGVRQGLQVLLRQIDGEGREPALTRIAVTVLHVERKLARRRDMLQAIRTGIEALAPQAAQLGSTHPTVQARLATLYANSVSQLRPRVLVQGNPQYLAQDTVVAEIRAVLLAAMRSAVLWRQVGGRYADFLLRRRGLEAAARSLLEGAGTAPA